VLTGAACCAAETRPQLAVLMGLGDKVPVANSIVLWPVRHRHKRLEKVGFHSRDLLAQVPMTLSEPDVRPNAEEPQSPTKPTALFLLIAMPRAAAAPGRPSRIVKLIGHAKSTDTAHGCPTLLNSEETAITAAPLIIRI